MINHKIEISESGISFTVKIGFLTSKRHWKPQDIQLQLIGGTRGLYRIMVKNGFTSKDLLLESGSKSECLEKKKQLEDILMGKKSGIPTNQVTPTVSPWV